MRGCVLCSGVAPVHVAMRRCKGGVRLLFRLKIQRGHFLPACETRRDGRCPHGGEIRKSIDEGRQGTSYKNDEDSRLYVNLEEPGGRGRFPDGRKDPAMIAIGGEPMDPPQRRGAPHMDGTQMGRRDPERWESGGRLGRRCLASRSW